MNKNIENKNTENKECEEICIKYINTKNYYNKLLSDKNCVTNSCRRRKEEFIGNLHILENLVKNCKKL